MGLVTLRKNSPSASCRFASRTVVATGTHLVLRRRTISGSLKTVTRPKLAEPQHGPSGWVPPLLEIHRNTGLFSLAASSRASRTESCQGIDQTFSVLILVSFRCSQSTPARVSRSAPGAGAPSFWSACPEAREPRPTPRVATRPRAIAAASHFATVMRKAPWARLKADADVIGHTLVDQRFISFSAG